MATCSWKLLIADGFGCTNVMFLSFAWARALCQVVKTAGTPRPRAAIAWRRVGRRRPAFIRIPPLLSRAFQRAASAGAGNLRGDFPGHNPDRLRRICSEGHNA